jgi:hypothetical protein
MSWNIFKIFTWKHVHCNLQFSSINNTKHSTIKTSCKHIDDLAICTTITLKVCNILLSSPSTLHNYYKIQCKLQLARGAQRELNLASIQLMFKSGVGNYARSLTMARTLPMLLNHMVIRWLRCTLANNLTTRREGPIDIPIHYLIKTTNKSF